MNVIVCTKDRKEIRISDCPCGCKVYACEDGHETVIHNSTYGCKEDKGYVCSECGSTNADHWTCHDCEVKK